MSQSPKVKEPKPEGSDEYIKLKVVGQDGAEVLFKVKYSTSMEKLKKSYAERIGVEVKVLRFKFDGQTINSDATPKTLEMEDGDSIDVFMEQVGGFRSSLC